MENERKCLFCGNTNLSKEHIFAQWLLRELEIEKNTVDMTHLTLIGQPISNRKHPFLNLVNGLVCETCNNGWMSKLESDCKDHIINILNGENLEAEFEYLSENPEPIAMWAFKNAILLNSASNYRQLVPDDHYKSLYEGSIPKGVFVDLAFYKPGIEEGKNGRIEWIQRPCLFIIKKVDSKNEFERKSYCITFRIKHIMFKVTFYETNKRLFHKNDGALQIFPQFGPYNEIEFFDDFQKYADNGVLHEY